MKKEEFSVGNGQVTAYRYGEPHLPWIVFFAGWGAEVADYEDRLIEMSIDFHILAFNLPGFGDHEPLDIKDNTVRGHATFFTNVLINDLGIDRPVVLMGHSTGAGVAAVVATMMQSLASHLVLVCPVGSPDPVHRSGVRLVRHINWQRARRWFQGRYRRRFVPNMRLGMDAKQLDLTEDLQALVRRGVTMRLFLADDDVVAPPGMLASSLDVAHIRWVSGGHSWFRHNARVVHEELLTIVNTVSSDMEPTDLNLWARMKYAVATAVDVLENLFVPSLPILVQTVHGADKTLEEENAQHQDTETR